MVRALIFALSLGLASVAQAACEGNDLISALPDDLRAELAADIAATPYPEGNLWRAERPGSRVLVVGTVHVPDPRLAPIVARALPHVEAADILILEATAEDEAAAQRILASRPDLITITEGPSLIDLLGAESWEKLVGELGPSGIPPFMAAKFQPWFLSMTLAMPPCLLETMGAGEHGLDRQLEDIALRAGVPITTLDEVEPLLESMAAMPMDEQLALLRLSLDTEADSESLIATLLESYFAERHRESWVFSKFAARAAGLEGAEDAFAHTEETLLIARNRAWEPRIAAAIVGKDAVIAVGAAHISGETGVLRALERMGYTLTRL